MKKEKLKQEFIRKSKERFGENTFDYSLVDYKNNSTKITLKCNRCNNIFEIVPSVHLESKTGCKFCNRKNSYMMISKEELLNQIKDKPIILLDDRDYYYKNKEKYRFKCTNCNKEFTKSIMYITKYNQLCPHCSKKKPRTKLNDLLKQAICDTNNYELISEFKGKSKVHTFKCKKHNYTFNMSFENFINNKFPCKHCKEEQKYINLLNRLNQKNLTLINKSGLLHDDIITVKCNKCNIVFDTTWFNIYQSEHGGCPKCSFQESKPEQEIIEFLKSLNINNIEHRFRIKNKEFDIYLPDYNLAIEYNGLLWHSYGKTHPNNYDLLDTKYHLNKTKLCEQNNIHLLHIFENEWIDPIKQSIWKSMIKHRLLKNSHKIYARQCIIKEINNTNEIKEFLNNNHIQGFINSKTNIGLYYNDELVSLMTFSKPRFNKKYEYELIRFCNKINYSVIGSASKLFKYFIRKYNPKSIISYGNRRWTYFKSNIYLTLGFKYVNETEPNYFYIDKQMNILNRMNYQKHMLKHKLDNFDNSLNERDNMINNGFRIIYDCGNLVYEWKKE